MFFWSSLSQNHFCAISVVISPCYVTHVKVNRTALQWIIKNRFSLSTFPVARGRTFLVILLSFRLNIRSYFSASGLSCVLSSQGDNSGFSFLRCSTIAGRLRGSPAFQSLLAISSAALYASLLGLCLSGIFENAYVIGNYPEGSHRKNNGCFFESSVPIRKRLCTLCVLAVQKQITMASLQGFGLRVFRWGSNSSSAAASSSGVASGPAFI